MAPCFAPLCRPGIGHPHPQPPAETKGSRSPTQRTWVSERDRRGSGGTPPADVLPRVGPLDLLLGAREGDARLQPVEVAEEDLELHLAWHTRKDMLHSFPTVSSTSLRPSRSPDDHTHGITKHPPALCIIRVSPVAVVYLWSFRVSKEMTTGALVPDWTVVTCTAAWKTGGSKMVSCPTSDHTNDRAAPRRDEERLRKRRPNQRRARNARRTGRPRASRPNYTWRASSGQPPHAQVKRPNLRAVVRGCRGEVAPPAHLGRIEGCGFRSVRLHSSINTPLVRSTCHCDPPESLLKPPRQPSDTPPDRRRERCPEPSHAARARSGPVRGTVYVAGSEAMTFGYVVLLDRTQIASCRLPGSATPGALFPDAASETTPDL